MHKVAMPYDRILIFSSLGEYEGVLTCAVARGHRHILMRVYIFTCACPTPSSDAGLGKSTMLLALAGLSSRSVFVGASTTSTTGLTVSLSKERGGEVGIEAGALILADQGVCCIDEFDKMAKTNQDGEFMRYLFP